MASNSWPSSVETTPDLVVTDIRMPPANFTEGLDAARVIREELPAHRRRRALGTRRRRARNGAAGRRAQHRVSAQEPGDRRRRLHRYACSASPRARRWWIPALVAGVGVGATARRPAGGAHRARTGGAGADRRRVDRMLASLSGFGSPKARWKSTCAASSPSWTCQRPRAIIAGVLAVITFLEACRYGPSSICRCRSRKGFEPPNAFGGAAW